MAEKGQVIEIKNNLVVVRMTRTEACAECRACIAGMSEKEMFIDAENECNAGVNDWVFVTLKDNGFLYAVLIMYGVPLIGLMLGFMIGYFGLYSFVPAINRELLAFGMGVVGIFIGFSWIKSQEKRWEEKKYRPVASSITIMDEPKSK